MNRNYTTIRPLFRCILAAAALAATIASGSFIDGLARGYTSDALLVASAQRLASAEHAR